MAGNALESLKMSRFCKRFVFWTFVKKSQRYVPSCPKVGGRGGGVKAPSPSPCATPDDSAGITPGHIYLRVLAVHFFGDFVCRLVQSLLFLLTFPDEFFLTVQLSGGALCEGNDCQHAKECLHRVGPLEQITFVGIREMAGEQTLKYDIWDI